MAVRDASALQAQPCDRRPRFGMVGEWSAATAAGRFASGLADALDAAQGVHGVHRVALDASIDPHTHPSRVVAVRSPRAVADELGQSDVAVVHVDEVDMHRGQGLLDVIELVHVPTIVVLHRVPAAPSSTDRAVLAELCRSADAVVVTSAPAAVRLTQGYGVDPAALWLIRSAYHEHGPGSTLLTWAIVAPGSGVEWMVDAMAHLQGLDLRYVVTGPGAEDQSPADRGEFLHALGQRSWRRGVAARITVETDDDDQTAVTELLAHAAAVIIPTDGGRELPDGFPDEILAAGVPIIATDGAGLADIRRCGGGLFVPSADAGALADAVVRIMIDPHLGQRMVDRAASLSPTVSPLGIGEQFGRIAAALAGSHAPRPSRMIPV